MLLCQSLKLLILTHIQHMLYSWNLFRMMFSILHKISGGYKTKIYVQNKNLRHHVRRDAVSKTEVMKKTIIFNCLLVKIFYAHLSTFHRRFAHAGIVLLNNEPFCACFFGSGDYRGYILCTVAYRSETE